MNLADLIVYTTAFLVLYCYLVFPMGLYVASKMRSLESSGVKSVAGEGSSPRVAVLCAAYNEEDCLAEKVDNFLQSDYPNAVLYLGSDGSTDGTDAIGRTRADGDRVRFFSFPRQGKMHVLNELLNQASADIVVFTDANSMFTPDAISRLVDAISDDARVGGVSGTLMLVAKSGHTGEGAYWRFENWIKNMESHICSIMGGNGAIYAVRRNLVHPLPPGTINDDFVHSMRVIEQGFAMKLCTEAKAYEDAAPDTGAEFHRHVRDAIGHYRALWSLRGLIFRMRPFCPFVLFWSHRILRWVIPLFLAASLLALPGLSQSPVNELVKIGVGVLVSLAGLGALVGRKMKVGYFVYYFFVLNFALFVGMMKNLFGRRAQATAWERSARG